MKWQYENGRIYSENENNELMAELTFIYKGNREVEIDHTYVNDVLRGQGIAGQMMEAMVEYLRAQGFKASATCTYANAWLKKNQERYPDIVSKTIS